MSEFKREVRYTVIKHNQLTESQMQYLKNCIFGEGIPTVEAVVIESDWPEFEPVWKMIEDRVTGAPVEGGKAEYDAMVAAMTTNQTIDGVPRELRALLERVVGKASQTPHWDALDEDRIAATAELRALLDGPVAAYAHDGGNNQKGDAPAITGATTQGFHSIGDGGGCTFTFTQAAQPQGEPVAWRTNRGGVCELFGSLQEAEDDIAQWASIAAPHDDYDRTPTPLYADQPGPVAADETAEFSKWTHQVIAESRIGGVTIKVQRMQHMTPGEEKSAHDAWMARADLSNKSR